MPIKSASFVISSADLEHCPKDRLPEFAFIGRSNVGKSSLINYLTHHEGLAKTSSMPGKTLLINHFLINKSWYIVDLPGYGFAKVSQSQREKLHKMITRYVSERETLYNLFVLVDSRIPPQQIDLDFMDFLGEEGVPFAIVFTKTDGVSQSQLAKNMKDYQARMLENWESMPPVFTTSSAKQRGEEALVDYMERILQDAKED